MGASPSGTTSGTPTCSGTGTRSGTATASATVTGSPTPSLSAGASPSASPSAPPSTSRSATGSATRSGTPSGTPSGTGSGTPSASPTTTITTSTTASRSATASPCPFLAVPLALQPYAVVAASAITGGSATLLSSLAISPNTASSVTGFPPATYTGALDAANGPADAAQSALAALILLIAALPPTLVAAEVGSSYGVPALAAGACAPFVLVAPTGLLVDGTLTLSGGPSDQFFFVAGTATTFSSVAPVTLVLAGGARASNVFWLSQTSATANAGSGFAGLVLAGASITFVGGGSLEGAAWASTAAVTLGAMAVALPDFGEGRRQRRAVAAAGAGAAAAAPAAAPVAAPAAAPVAARAPRALAAAPAPCPPAFVDPATGACGIAGVSCAQPGWAFDPLASNCAPWGAIAWLAAAAALAPGAPFDAAQRAPGAAGQWRVGGACSGAGGAAPAPSPAVLAAVAAALAPLAPELLTGLSLQLLPPSPAAPCAFELASASAAALAQAAVLLAAAGGSGGDGGAAGAALLQAVGLSAAQAAALGGAVNAALAAGGSGVASLSLAPAASGAAAAGPAGAQRFSPGSIAGIAAAALAAAAAAAAVAQRLFKRRRGGNARAPAPAPPAQPPLEAAGGGEAVLAVGSGGQLRRRKGAAAAGSALGASGSGGKDAAHGP